jgi:alkylation response protein AidB-like acyl-CoA dehydrogenase
MAVSHLSDDEQALIEAIREIAQERVAPRAAEIDHTSQFPWNLKDLLSQQDILAMPFPSEYGGYEGISCRAYDARCKNYANLRRNKPDSALGNCACAIRRVVDWTILALAWTLHL